MEYNLHLKNMARVADLESTLAKKIEKLKSRLSNYKEDMVHLNIEIEKNSHTGFYSTKMTLALPPKTFHIEEIEGDMWRSINKTFQSLYRQVDKLKEKLSSYIHKKKPRETEE